MVQAWYMDSELSDPQAEHHKNPPEYVPIEDLSQKTGVEYFKINVDTYKTDGVLENIKKQRGYTYEDELVCSNQCENYEAKLKTFFTEHLHKDEEIRLVLEGAGYFDVRDNNDQWVRIKVTAGDMLVLPSGIYHRFIVSPENYIKAKRFFIGEPVWLAFNRPAEDMPCRRQYVERLHKGFSTAAC